MKVTIKTHAEVTIDVPGVGQRSSSQAAFEKVIEAFSKAVGVIESADLADDSTKIEVDVGTGATLVAGPDAFIDWTVS